MNVSSRLTILIVCAMLCAGGIFSAKTQRAAPGPGQGNSTGPIDLLNEYLYAATETPIKLSLGEIEGIVRRDPVMKSHRGRIEFGSVKVVKGAVLAEVMFLRGEDAGEAFLCKLMQKNDSWYVASAQKLWFVPRSHFLRGLKA